MKHDPDLIRAADLAFAEVPAERTRRSFAADGPHRHAPGLKGAWQWLTDPLTERDGRAIVVASGLALAAGTVWIALGAPFVG